jgi:hypothetical protein
MFQMGHPPADDLEMALKLVNLVLGSCQPIVQRIDLLEAAEPCPDDQQGSLEGVLDGQLELSRLVCALNNLSKVDLGRWSAWNTCLHCNGSKFGSVLFKSEITQFRALKIVPEQSSQKCPSASVGVHTVMLSWALCTGRGDWYC